MFCEKSLQKSLETSCGATTSEAQVIALFLAVERLWKLFGSILRTREFQQLIDVLDNLKKSLATTIQKEGKNYLLDSPLKKRDCARILFSTVSLKFS